MASTLKGGRCVSMGRRVGLVRLGIWISNANLEIMFMLLITVQIPTVLRSRFGTKHMIFRSCAMVGCGRWGFLRLGVYSRRGITMWSRGRMWNIMRRKIFRWIWIWLRVIGRGMGLGLWVVKRTLGRRLRGFRF